MPPTDIHIYACLITIFIHADINSVSNREFVRNNHPIPDNNHRR